MGSRTTEEENVEEDGVVEDQLDRLKKQYNTVCEMWAEYRTACDRCRKEEENVKEDGVVEDISDRIERKFGIICEVFRSKKQYDEMVTEYNIEYRKYKDNMKATMMNITAKLEEMLQHQEQQEEISLTMKDGTEDNKWSAGSERTCETESMDSGEREQAITKLEVIDGRKK